MESTKEKRATVLEEWYRAEIKKEISKLISKWEDPMGVSVKEFGVKRMKTRWGTCNIRDRRIWLNLELAKKSPDCLEYVVVHEMVHLLERLHNKRFHNFMDQFFPEWRQIKKKLNGKN
ncbi:MAG: SprT-like domain-containing protein [Balneolaceae bacterium]